MLTMARRLGGLFLLLSLLAQPCEISVRRGLWEKKPGSASKFFAFERNGKVGFINERGKVVIAPRIEASIDEVGDFSDGFARVGNHGYIDTTGSLAIHHHDYCCYSDFSEGRASAATDDPASKYEKLGLILDKNANVVATTRAFALGEFSEGLAAYEAKGKRGIRKFTPLLEYRDFPGLKGFAARTGKLVIPPSFADVGPFKNGLARAALDGYCYLVTAGNYRQGSPTSGYPSSCGGAPADAVTPCRVGFINTQGNFAIEARFESAQDFSESLAAVRIGGLWGFIDSTGSVVIPPRFEQVQPFREGLAAVKHQGKWGFIDKAGTVAIPARFESVDSFSDSLAIAYRDSRPFFIDREGRTALAGSYQEATPFVHGLAAVLLARNRVAYINRSGKTVFQYVRR